MPPTAPSLEARTAGIPFDELSSFSSLFRDYTGRFERLAEFYARDWRSAPDRRAAVRDASAFPRDRQTLVEVLREQQDHWGSDPATNRQVDRLLDPGSAAVVTGQQVGLFTGPLYTVLKAMTTVRLARRLEEETGQPVVPVFWLGSEDHDFAEMATATVPSLDGPVDLSYDGHRLPRIGNLGSVGALAFAPSISALVDRLEALLAGTEFAAPVMRAVRDAYRPGTTFTDAFARLLRALLPGTGLVLLSAEDVRLKRLALPLWKRELTDSADLHERLDRTSARVAAGWHAQVRTAPTNLFIEHGGARLPIDLSDGLYRVRTTDLAYDRASLLALLESETHRFTPNVVLRPLTQDLLLPTAAYVAGPGEVAYFAQFRGAYEWAGLPMPVIHPRSTVTLVEPRVERLLERVALAVTDFQEPVDPLFTRIVLDALGVDLEGAFSRTDRSIRETLAGLDATILTVDPGMGARLEATRTQISKDLTRLREQVLRAQRRRHAELRTQVRHAADSLFPGGAPQERVLSPLWFAARFGPGLLLEVMERLDVFAPDHQVLYVTEAP